jgi:hypothetical protein
MKMKALENLSPWVWRGTEGAVVAFLEQVDCFAGDGSR